MTKNNEDLKVCGSCPEMNKESICKYNCGVRCLFEWNPSIPNMKFLCLYDKQPERMQECEKYEEIKKQKRSE